MQTCCVGLQIYCAASKIPLALCMQVQLDFLVPKQTCNCKSTSCLKLYCVCFASGAASFTVAFVHVPGKVAE